MAEAAKLAVMGCKGVECSRSDSHWKLGALPGGRADACCRCACLVVFTAGSSDGMGLAQIVLLSGLPMAEGLERLLRTGNVDEVLAQAPRAACHQLSARVSLLANAGLGCFACPLCTCSHSSLSCLVVVDVGEVSNGVHRQVLLPG